MSDATGRETDSAAPAHEAPAHEAPEHEAPEHEAPAQELSELETEGEGPAAKDDAARALCLLFRVAGERYALRALDVFKVVEPGWINRLPRLPGSVVGISQHRGRIVTVVDLAVFFGGPPRRLELSSTTRILVLDQGQRNLGLFVDAVEQIATLRLPRPRADGAVLSVFQHQGAAVNALSVPRLLERLLALGEDMAA